MDQLREFLELNSIFTGGVGVVAFTALLATLRHIPGQLLYLLRRRLFTVVDLADHDPAYFWVEKWLEQQDAIKNGRLFTVSTRTRPAGQMDEGNVIGEVVPVKKRKVVDLIWAPAPGTHLLNIDGTLVLLMKERKQIENVTGHVAYHETLTFLTRHRDVVRNIVLAARELAFPLENPTTEIWTAEGWRWTRGNKRPIRPLSSVVLPGNMAQELLKDLQSFATRRSWYREHAVPYQRGYLFEGTPGSGKTSLALALAGALQRDLFVMRAGSASDESFGSLMNALPEEAILLVEDIDCVFTNRESTKEKSDSRLTFSAFLNGLDGATAPDARILFMTTNHVEKLDPALLRPGRVDRQVHFSNATHEQATKLFLHFFPGEQKYAERFGTYVHTSKSVSMAKLQEHIISNMENVVAASTFSGDEHGHS